MAYPPALLNKFRFLRGRDYMRISMSVSIKIFFRSIIYLAICAVLFLLSNFFLMRFFNASNYLAEFHVASLKLGIVGYIVFSFLSYEYTNLPRTSALQEALEIIPSSRSKLLCSQSLVLISLLLIWSINIFGNSENMCNCKFTTQRSSLIPFPASLLTSSCPE